MKISFAYRSGSPFDGKGYGEKQFVFLTRNSGDRKYIACVYVRVRIYVCICSLIVGIRNRVETPLNALSENELTVER